MEPISIDDALASSDAISQVGATPAGVFWLASIAREDGRTTVRRFRDGEVTDLTPEANVRSRVMEYGGGAYDVAGDTVAYCDDRTRRVMLLEDGRARALTDGDARFRFGGLHLVPQRRLLVCVREDHSVEPEERTEIVALDLDSDNPDGGRVLVTGADFYAGPVVRGDRLAWYQWQHPDMSWDAAEVLCCPLDDPADITVVGDGAGVSNQHPMWLDDETIAWSSDRSGWWNWTTFDGEQRLTWGVARDCDEPTWVLDRPAACAVNPDLVATIEIKDGRGGLSLWQPSTGGVTHALPGTAWIESIASCADDLYIIAAWPDRPESLVHISPAGVVEEIVAAQPLQGAVAPQVVWSDGDAGPVQSFFYPVPGVERPPLLVMTHGGPTSAADASYDLQRQFWVSRGFAVLDVNYSGSTGFGRAYRDRLRGRWGLLDVSDVVAAVRSVTDRGLADPARVAITGGSAGGYTTLQALVTSDVFAAGMSQYGIGDLTTLATDTHKAESRYPDGLVGPWPEAREEYLRRSPITQLDNLRTPMLVLQGLDDKVVPPNQAFDMAEAVRAKGMPLALVTFEGEGHGFRSMAARRAALEAKVSFLQQVFGLPHSDDVPVLPIENLPSS